MWCIRHWPMLVGIIVLPTLGWPGAVAAERRPMADDRQVDEPGEPSGETHRIERGETLSEIAVEHGIDLQELLTLNPGIDPDRIRSGSVIRVDDSRRKVQHVVVGGDTLSGLARHYRVSIRELKRWNPRLASDRIRIGRRLLVYTEVPESHSRSVGTPSRGRLEHGVRLSTHPGYEIRTRDRAWGTQETVDWIKEAFSEVRKQHPDAPRVRIHDLSHRLGGPMADHKSHQSGRDADIAYYQSTCKGGLCGFRPTSASRLDLERQWTLLHHWLERDQLEAVFIDYRLQGPLYRHARRQGVGPDQLKKWFQYPNGKDHPVGIIRHYPKHADHLHVRFACHESDETCKTFRPLLNLSRHASRARLVPAAE